MFQHLDVMEKDLLYRLRLVNGQSAGADLQPHPLLEESPDGNGGVRLG